MEELVGQTLKGRYRIDALIGRGGMADVYKVWDKGRSAYVAIKVLNEDLAEDFVFLRRFAREADALERLEHPHIVRLLGFEQAPGVAFIVMEYIQGLTLRRYLNLLSRPLTLPEALSVLQPVCGALHYAHRVGIYHCDVKPANIFIAHGGRVVLGDFGIARLSESATVTFSTPGTPAYMSPEQCRGGQNLDGRTDIYSLGITVYEMLTLDRPFKGEASAVEGSRGERVRWEQLNVPPPRPRSINPEIPPATEIAILHALEKDPRRRQQRMLEFAEELRQAAAAEPVRLLPEVVEKRAELIEPTLAPREAVKTGAPRLVLGLGVIAISLVLLVVLILGGVGIPRPPTDPEELVVTESAGRVTQPPRTPADVAAPPAVVASPTSAPPPPVVVPSDTYVLYVLDGSNSMEDELPAVREELSQHLQADPTINAGLLVYGHILVLQRDFDPTIVYHAVPRSEYVSSRRQHDTSDRNGARDAPDATGY